jgi:hypothetical protein
VISSICPKWTWSSITKVIFISGTGLACRGFAAVLSPLGQVALVIGIDRVLGGLGDAIYEIRFPDRDKFKGFSNRSFPVSRRPSWISASSENSPPEHCGIDLSEFTPWHRSPENIYYDSYSVLILDRSIPDLWFSSIFDSCTLGYFIGHT